MLIIIEGADKTGKTTLAREISSRLGYAYKHFGPPGKEPAEEYARFLTELKAPTVCDRFFYGELVYGPLLRGKSCITSLQKTVIERLCRLKGAILIHAATPLSLVSQRMLRIGDEMITLEQNEKAYELFNDVLKATSLPKLEFSAQYAVSAEKFVWHRLEILAFNKRVIAERAAKVATGIGTIDRPLLVLVGESLNANKTWLGLPFDGGGSANYLNDCLQKSRINEANIYVVNADTLTQQEINFLLENSAVKFVALGKKATEKLRSFGIHPAELHHPQYWSRFHADEQETYIKMLEDSAL